ncbi:hypothetical protein [Roseivivax marinus]|uniref:hypothetical protein n=1 Tax=Roseivivax marinus TaxID=1379903 RepID=UPI0011138326|nr:hypothetical protein [Roseivivax marinus]
MSIVSNLATRELEAWLGSARLWSVAPEEPGSADEVAEFFTVTLIRLFAVVDGMSAHEQMELLSRVSGTASDDIPPGDVLGAFPG